MRKAWAAYCGSVVFLVGILAILAAWILTLGTMEGVRAASELFGIDRKG